MRKRVASGSTPDAVGARPTTRFSGGRECWSSTTAYSVRTTGAASVELPSDEQATLGGRDVVDTVRELLGSVSHFDFQQVGRDLPRVDVPDLERFFTLAVGRHRRRVFKHANGLEIKAPETWKLRSYAVRDRYDGLVFNRDLRGANAASRVLGVGHTLFDIALDEARNLPARVAVVDGASVPVLVVAVEDEVTGSGNWRPPMNKQEPLSRISIDPGVMKLRAASARAPVRAGARSPGAPRRSR